MAVDLGVFQRQVSLLDRQKLQEEFEAKKALQQVQLAQALTTGGVQAPSAVQEFKYYQGLPPEAQQEYLNVKRSSQLINQGNQIAVRAPSGGIVESYPINVNPNNSPSLKAAQTAAQTNARINAEAGSALDTKATQANGVLDLIDQAEKILPVATSGRLDNAGTAVKGLFGVSDPETQADAQLELIAGGLTSNVPRFEGPQGVADVKLYQAMAADVGNRNKPAGDRLAALQEMKRLNQKYTKQGTSRIPSPAMPAPITVSPAANLIRIQDADGQMYDIPPEDLQQALSEGAKRL